MTSRRGGEYEVIICQGGLTFGCNVEVKGQRIKKSVNQLVLAQRQLSEFVCDAVHLEGINFTFPEIQTLLDGVTIGGRKIVDQQIALNQSEAWKTLF